MNSTSGIFVERKSNSQLAADGLAFPEYLTYLHLSSMRFDNAFTANERIPGQSSRTPPLPDPSIEHGYPLTTAVSRGR